MSQLLLCLLFYFDVWLIDLGKIYDFLVDIFMLLNRFWCRFSWECWIGGFMYWTFDIWIWLWIGAFCGLKGENVAQVFSLKIKLTKANGDRKLKKSKEISIKNCRMFKSKEKAQILLFSRKFNGKVRNLPSGQYRMIDLL